MSKKEDGVMTVQELSVYLRLAESTIYKLAQEGQIPGRKIGGRWRFSREGILRWLEKTDPIPQNVRPEWFNLED